MKETIPSTKYIHLSWSDVQERIERVRDGVDSENSEVRIFLSHYLDIVKRLTSPPRLETNYFTRLVQAHRPLLKRLLKEVKHEEEGTQSLLKYASPDHRAARERLRPGTEAADEIDKVLPEYNKGHSGQAFARQVWNGLLVVLAKGRRGEGVGYRVAHEVELTFSHRNVRAGLYFELNGKTRPILERIEEFMREEIATDMFTWRWKSDSNYVYIYRHRLMNEEALSVGSFEEVESATREKVGAFLDSDYRTIQGYFQCLAADPRRFSAGERST